MPAPTPTARRPFARPNAGWRRLASPPSAAPRKPRHPARDRTSSRGPWTTSGARWNAPRRRRRKHAHRRRRRARRDQARTARRAAGRRRRGGRGRHRECHRDDAEGERRTDPGGSEGGATNDAMPESVREELAQIRAMLLASPLRETPPPPAGRPPRPGTRDTRIPRTTTPTSSYRRRRPPRGPRWRRRRRRLAKKGRKGRRRTRG